jgi:hypothetical protein
VVFFNFNIQTVFGSVELFFINLNEAVIVGLNSKILLSRLINYHWNLRSELVLTFIGSLIGLYLIISDEKVCTSKLMSFVCNLQNEFSTNWNYSNSKWNLGQNDVIFQYFPMKLSIKILFGKMRQRFEMPKFPESENY